MFQIHDPVYIHRCEGYDPAVVEAVLREQFTKLGLLTDALPLQGKKVVIKPNLVMKMAPESGGTTHPLLVKTAAKLLSEGGAAVWLAESPGGLYSESLLRSVYRGCGMEEAAKDGDFSLNYDLSAREVPCPEGVQSKMFHLITPVLDCDLLINFSKLKTHGLTSMSAAVKNLFGTVPGTEKLEMHARFTEENDFENMLLDLCTLHHRNVEVINLCDAVIGMEGNGPTGGSPRPLGVILASRNPYNLDRVAARLIGLDGKVPMLQKAVERGYAPEALFEIPTEGNGTEMSPVPFLEPDSRRQSRLQWLLTFGGGRFKRLLEPRPLIDRKKCKGCGDCLRSCPRKTIQWQSGKGAVRRQAKILPKACIRCYCCQELCPHRAVKIKKRLIMKIADRIRF